MGIDDSDFDHELDSIDPEEDSNGDIVSVSDSPLQKTAQMQRAGTSENPFVIDDSPSNKNVFI